MSTVTYKNQPAIQKTHGKVALAGNKHPYTVHKVLWPKDVEAWIGGRLLGRSLHVCCGISQLGDVRIDLHLNVLPQVLGNAAFLPFADRSFDTVLADPPYNGKYGWTHRMLAELGRVARKRIVFQHWFLPVNEQGEFKKYHAFKLVDSAIWQGRAYFGRVQVISIMDREGEIMSEVCQECGCASTYDTEDIALQLTVLIKKGVLIKEGYLRVSVKPKQLGEPDGLPVYGLKETRKSTDG